MEYQLGDVAILRGSFIAEESQSNYDPPTVKVFVRTPRGVETSYEYGVDTAVVRDGPGLFRYDLTVAQVGRSCSAAYYFRWVGYDADGVPLAGAEGAVEVAASHFATPF